MKIRAILVFLILFAFISTCAFADNRNSLPEEIQQILAKDNWSIYSIGRTTYGDNLSDYGTDACSFYDQYGNAAALVLMHSNSNNILCLFEKNNSGNWKLSTTFTDVIQQGNSIPLITSETYGTFLISYLDNDTNEKSGLTISKSGNKWTVASNNRRDSEGHYIQGKSKLVFGDTGEQVKLLQQALTKLGFSTQGIDGNFGKNTLSAVKAFQKKYGLTVDGKAGPKTLNKLYSLADAQQDPVSPTDSSSTSEDDSVDATRRTDVKLVYGDKGVQVRYMQQALTQLGLYSKSVDGSFGQGTLAAVKAFQKKYGLSVDGKAGTITLSKLYSLVDNQQGTDPTPPSSSSEPEARRTDIKLVFGDKGDQVRYLQEALTQLGFSTNGIDGKFGAGTLSAVRKFQSQNNLTVDGKAGPITLTLLYSLVSTN